MSTNEWNATTATCRKCKGTGLYLVDVASLSVRDPRECFACGGTGEIEKAPPPNADERAVARKGEIAALFVPRGDEGREGGAGAGAAPVLGQVGPGSLETWGRLVETWWRRDRDARIRAGACAACGERGCACLQGGAP